jgi:hypothetical protein
MLEVVGSDTMRHHKMAVLTVDNGRIGYHEVNIDDPSLFFVTNPIDKTRLFAGQVFNESGTSLRLIAFTPHRPVISVRGAAQGQLSCDRAPDFWLCSTPLVLPPGDYSVDFEGDFTSSLRFTVANATLPFREKVYPLSYTTQEYIAVALCFLLHLIITIPLPIGGAMWEKYLEWLSGDSSGGWQYWLFSILSGFIAVRMRVQTLPHIMRWSLLFVAIAPVCIPLVITSVEGHIGGVWLLGHICDGHLTFYVFAPLLVLGYQALILMPIIIIYAAIAAPRHPVQFADLGFALLSLAGLIGFDLKYATESAGSARALVAPLLSFVPMWLWGLAVHEIWRTWPSSTPESVDTDPGLLDDEDALPPPPALEETKAV